VTWTRAEAEQSLQSSERNISNLLEDAADNPVVHQHLTSIVATLRSQVEAAVASGVGTDVLYDLLSTESICVAMRGIIAQGAKRARPGK
jgi:hypothetical protein